MRAGPMNGYLESQCELTRKKQKLRLTISRTSSAVRHGTVDFSTTMAPTRACLATSQTTASNAVRSIAQPAPTPLVLVGVFTALKITSASAMQRCTSVEKNRFGARAGISVVFLAPSCPCPCPQHAIPHPSDDVDMSHVSASDLLAALLNVNALPPSRAMRTMERRSGSWMGRCREFHLRIRAASLSTTFTRIWGLWYAMTAAVGPPVDS